MQRGQALIDLFQFTGIQFVAVVKAFQVGNGLGQLYPKVVCLFCQWRQPRIKSGQFFQTGSRPSECDRY